MLEFRNLLQRVLSEHTPRHAGVTDRIPAAVLVPFFEKDKEPHLLFTKRTSELQHHGGEICFPGGARDLSDPDLLTTALREMHEELAIPSSSIEVLGRLDEIRTVSSSFLVVPFVGFLKQPFELRPSEQEVQEVLEIPLRHFKDESIFREEMRLVDRQMIRVYYYQWQNHTIWGLTGRILKQVLDLLENAGQRRRNA